MTGSARTLLLMAVGVVAVSLSTLHAANLPRSCATIRRYDRPSPVPSTAQ